MTSAQWPGHSCRKMCRSNTCRKLRKCAENPSGPTSNYENARKMGKGQAIIFRDSDFLLPIGGSTFSGQVSAIEARDEAIFTRIKRLPKIQKNNS